MNIYKCIVTVYDDRFSIALTTASECDRYCKDELLYIDDNLDVNNRTIKTFRSLMIEDSRMVPG